MKRTADGGGGAGSADEAAPGKRARTGASTAIVAAVDTSKALVAKATGTLTGRSSKLSHPSLCLEGHGDAVYGVAFSPSGQHLASASRDRSVFLWDVYGDNENYCVLSGHKNAVLDVHWSTDGGQIYTCSADKTVSVWDASVGCRHRKLTGHTGIVNACSPARRGPDLVASASDDCTAKVWDVRSKRVAQTLTHPYMVTCTAFGDDGSKVFTGSIDNTLLCWDLRKEEVVFEMRGHADTPSYMRLSPDGNTLLTNAMDETLRAWDVRPFCATDRCMKVFPGVKHNFEKNLLGCAWSPNGERVGAASSDNHMYIWEFETMALQYTLAGHKGAVTCVDFHPKEPVVISGSSDKTMFLSEISVV